MKAVSMRGRRAVYGEVADPVPAPGEILVRVTHATICRTEATPLWGDEVSRDRA